MAMRGRGREREREREKAREREVEHHAKPLRSTPGRLVGQPAVRTAPVCRVRWPPVPTFLAEPLVRGDPYSKSWSRPLQLIIGASITWRPSSDRKRERGKERGREREREIENEKERGRERERERERER